MNFKKLIKNFKEKSPKSKSSLLIIIGILGLLLVLLSSFNDSKPKENKSTTEIETLSNSNNDKEYVNSMESRLENILSDMLGGTNVNVMITLESGSRFVYANEVKSDSGTKDYQDQQKMEQSDSNQQTYVIMKNSEGAEQALLITEIMPKIRGVVVVCDSGQSEYVSTAVRTAVQSALDITAEKICIIGRY